MSRKRLFKNLPPEPRRKILAFIQAPSYTSWCAIRDIKITNAGQTLADILVDLKWNSIYPHALLVAKASRLAEARDRDLACMEM